MNPVERVKQALAASGLDADLVRELPADTSTAEAAARAVDAPQGSIVKSLIFLADSVPMLVLVSGDQRADVKRLRAALGLSKRRLRIAQPSEVFEHTGFEVGGVPPVGHRTPLRTFIDRTLSRFETVWAAAGNAHAVFPIAFGQLVSITGGEVMDLVRESAKHLDRTAIASQDAQLRTKAGPQAAELIALQQTALDVSAQKEIPVLLQSIVERATRLLNATGGGAFLAKDEEDRLKLVASHNLDEDSADAALKRGERLADHPISRWALTQRRPVAIQASDPDANPVSLEWMKKEDVQSLLTVPPVARDEAIGLLGVMRVHEAREFTANEIALCQALANLAATALQNANLHESVRRANEAKSEFIDFVAHELKQPMTAMQGYAKMLTMGIGGELNDQQLQFVQVINSNVDRMGRLVNNLLEISRLEAGRTKLKLAPVQLKEVVEEILSNAGAEIEARHHTLEVDAPDDLPPVLGDRERLVQILNNLVSNAYRYTPDGGTIRIAVNGQDRPRVPAGHLCVNVSDTGIGMSPEDLVRLEERFFRGEHDLVQQQPGTGLGVSITRGLVELHGGEFLIESEPGQGSTFSFTVPIVDASDG